MFKAFDEVAVSAVTEIVAITITEAVEQGDEVSDEVKETSQVKSIHTQREIVRKQKWWNRFYFAEFRMCRMWHYWESSKREQYWIQEKGETRRRKWII